MLDDGRYELAGQGRSRLVPLGFREVALEDGLRGALAEVGFEDRSQREPTSRPTSALLVSLQRRRR
jgi:hypothetical protein